MQESELANYDPSIVERKWAEHWDSNKTFQIENPLDADYAISLPPPNVTGDLHMGHALNCTLQDILIRYKRMKGLRVHWQVGSDHAGIGTQIVVEKQLAKENINKYDLGKKAFIERVWDWTRKNKGRIEQQMKLLGCSADWSKSNFTLDSQYARAVLKAFFDLFKKDAIYRGTRLVNWCPHCLTSLSDLEVIHEKKKSKLYKIKYILTKPIEDLNELIVTTSRPETLLGDVAVAVNPKDQRYSQIIKAIKNNVKVEVKLPLVEKNIPVVLSDSVELDFGTGALKITPAHDFNDYKIAKDISNERNKNKYKDCDFSPIKIFDDKARILPLDFIPAYLHGIERFKARDLVVKVLEESELLCEIEDYEQASALHDRCGNVIEPHLSAQWFVNMTKKLEPHGKSLAELAISALNDKKIKFHPERYAKTYLDWLNNIQDWCISRQLWWGHEIPVFYTENSIKKETLDELLGKDNYIFRQEKNEESEGNEQVLCVENPSSDLVEKLKELGFKKDPDVLDTWFSSALWPFASQGWHDKNTNKPVWTNVLSTAREIINLWVSRMIFSSLNLTDKLPFEDILIHPVIQTPDGKRMSKSKGNAIDPVELINKYGADGSRLWYCSVGIFSHQDVRFPGVKEKKDGREEWSSNIIESERRFVNKLWNAIKFVISNTKPNASSINFSVKRDELKNSFNIWIWDLWKDRLFEASQALEKYNFEDFSVTLENFVWNDFCDWYLEIAKVNIAENKDSEECQRVMFCIAEEMLRALNPVIPFVTEELWNALNKIQNKPVKSMAFESYPEGKEIKTPNNPSSEINILRAIIQTIRSFRQDALGLSPSFPVKVSVSTKNNSLTNNFNWAKLARVEAVNEISGLCLNQLDNYISVSVGIPSEVNLKERHEKLSKTLEKKKVEVSKLSGRLNNEGFMKNAEESVKKALNLEIQKLDSEIHELKSVLEQIAKMI